MSRLFAPTLGVLLLAVLIGCGGDGTSLDTTTTGTIPTTGGSTDGGTTGGDTTTNRASAGTYSVVLAGSDNASTATNYAGTGTATVDANGTVTIAGLSTTATGGTTGTVSRTLSLTVTTAGVVTGTLTVGSTVSALAGTAAYQSNGTYLATVTSTNGTTTETDRYTLTVNLPGAGTYKGTDAGTDTAKTTYSGTGTATLGASGSLGVVYTSAFRIGSATITKTNSISSATLTNDGAFAGTLNQGANGAGGTGSNSSSGPVSGKWTLAGKVLTLKFSYVNTSYTATPSGGGAAVNPTATETLTLTKQ